MLDIMHHKDDENQHSNTENEEIDYRPYRYPATPFTRPLMQARDDGKGIRYTEWNEEHQFNYFRYWIGRYEDAFSDDTKGCTAEDITNALKTVVLRDEYDLDNIREDLIMDLSGNKNGDPEESMILNEDEFTAFNWNTKQQYLFRRICCEVIDIIPFYKQWIQHLAECKSIDDMVPKNNAPCPHLPCPSLHRLLIASRFSQRWMEQNFGDHLVPKTKFHFAVHDFMNCLENYNFVEFQNDWHHLYHCHIEPTNAANKAKTCNDDADNSNDESTEDSDSDTEDDDENKSENGTDENGMVLDAENRNVYEWFEDHLGDCDEAKKCSIFERAYRARYDVSFDKEAQKYYRLHGKEKDEWLEGVAEIQCQKILDGMHTALFHSSARFDSMGLGNSESHRKFVMLSTEMKQKYKAK